MDKIRLHIFAKRMRIPGYDGSTQAAGSWGRFARKISTNNNMSNAFRTTETQGDSIWLYFGISFVYFFLIAVVILILLLAPKFRSPPPPNFHFEHDHGHVNSVIEAETNSKPQTHIPLTADDEVDYPKTESKGEASRKDPLYEIDPRSIFRGDLDNGKRARRINSKFLQL